MNNSKPTQKGNFISYSSVARPQRISFLGTDVNTVKAALAEVFGTFPIRLSKKDSNILAGMCAASGDGRQPYEQLCVAIDHHGELEIVLED